MLPDVATLFAPAKLTLSLRVTGIRYDGMHLIDAEMITLDFGDTLEMSAGTGVEYTGTYDGEGDGSDLVSRALALVGAQRQIHVTKRIHQGLDWVGDPQTPLPFFGQRGLTTRQQRHA